MTRTLLARSSLERAHGATLARHPPQLVMRQGAKTKNILTHPAGLNTKAHESRQSRTRNLSVYSVYSVVKHPHPRRSCSAVRPSPPSVDFSVRHQADSVTSVVPTKRGGLSFAAKCAENSNTLESVTPLSVTFASPAAKSHHPLSVLSVYSVVIPHAAEFRCPSDGILMPVGKNSDGHQKTLRWASESTPMPIRRDSRPQRTKLQRG